MKRYRLYAVEEGERAVDSSAIATIPNAVAKFIIKPDNAISNKNWNGVHQADLEGYVLVQENGETKAFKIVGFGSDSKVLLDTDYYPNQYTNLQLALLNQCYAYDAKTDNPLSYEKVKELLSITD